MTTQAEAASSKAHIVKQATVYVILAAISSVHMMNDMMQVVVTALFPVLKDTLQLNLAQIGWIAFTLNMTSSVLQPAVGLVSDRRPAPWLLPLGMCSSLLGMIGLALAPSFYLLLGAVVLVGLGSAVFHTEGSRVVHLAAGNRRAFAQSIYQVGGNFGHMLGPVMTMFIFLPLGQKGALWGTLLAVTALLILIKVVPWYRTKLNDYNGMMQKRKAAGQEKAGLAPRVIALALAILCVIVFARSWYAAAIGNFYQFYAVEAYGLTIKAAQIPLFLFMAAGVAGTFFGGMLADRIGRKKMMLISIVGAAPFALALPHLPIGWVYPLIVVLGFILQSGFSVSVVYAQELLPGKVGTASGLITGLAFGMGGLGAVVLGYLADMHTLSFVMGLCSVLPLLGLLGIWLPKDRR
jgi:FSR family fosmidomycin resistance protein-like MFS transporter